MRTQFEPLPVVVDCFTPVKQQLGMHNVAGVYIALVLFSSVFLSISLSVCLSVCLFVCPQWSTAAPGGAQRAVLIAT